MEYTMAAAIDQGRQRVSTLFVWCLLAILVCGVHRTHGWGIVSRRPVSSPFCTGTSINTVPGACSHNRKAVLSPLSAKDDPESEGSMETDDGWDDDDDKSTLTTVPPGSSLVQEPLDGSAKGEPPERDLFIPIFSLLSIAGLLGAYGYEMLRLASRGELYLPWNQ